MLGYLMQNYIHIFFIFTHKLEVPILKFRSRQTGCGDLVEPKQARNLRALLSKYIHLQIYFDYTVQHCSMC